MNIESQKSGRIRFYCFVIICGLVVIALATLVIVVVFPARNTSFSSAWSQEGFNSINVGDNVHEAFLRLGTPLHMSICKGRSGGFPEGSKSPSEADVEASAYIDGGYVILGYSKCMNRYGEAYRNVFITIENGRVKEKRDELYHEWW